MIETYCPAERKCVIVGNPCREYTQAKVSLRSTQKVLWNLHRHVDVSPSDLLPPSLSPQPPAALFLWRGLSALENDLFLFSANESCPRDRPRRCADKTQCYRQKERCDGFINCFDKSDELNCSPEGIVFVPPEGREWVTCTWMLWPWLGVLLQSRKAPAGARYSFVKHHKLINLELTVHDQTLWVPHKFSTSPLVAHTHTHTHTDWHQSCLIKLQAKNTIMSKNYIPTFIHSWVSFCLLWLTIHSFTATTNSTGSISVLSLVHLIPPIPVSYTLQSTPLLSNVCWERMIWYLVHFKRDIYTFLQLVLLCAWHLWTSQL